MAKIQARSNARHLWMLRLAYGTALTVFVLVCYLFYNQQTRQNTQTDIIRNISDSFATFDESLAILSEKAANVAAEYESARNIQPEENSIAGLTLKQKKEYLQNLPVDTDIIGIKTALRYHTSRAAEKFALFEKAWAASMPQLHAEILKSSRLMIAEDPFRHHIRLIDPKLVGDARTKDDIYWVAKQISEGYGTIVASDRGMQKQLRAVLDARSAGQGNLLRLFLKFTLGAVFILAIAVFIPVDFFLQRLLRKLSSERRRAEGADRAKSEFLANMSHEIRTPMNGVMGMAELLARTELDSKQTTFTDIILKSGASLLTIINDILDFSKIDAGQMELDPAPFNLTEAIEDVATLVSTNAQEKDIELIVRVDPALPAVLIGDVGRIRQIVTNLMGNAVKFTEKGHVFVDVSGEAHGQTGSGGPGSCRLHFRVEDTGVGIAEDKRIKIFEKFSQVDTSATRKHEGTGLGLTISAALVELMGGRIGVDSEEGKGSVFWFAMDLLIGHGGERKQPVPHDIRGAHILIVDDNAVNRSILNEQMSAWGFRSTIAASGHEALALLAAAASAGTVIDAVALDYQMPVMNGGDVVSSLRADPAFGDIPVVMLTSVDQTEDGEAFSSLGIQGQLIKPARSALIQETIIRVLQESRTKRAAAAEKIPPAATPVVKPVTEPVAQPVMEHAPAGFAGDDMETAGNTELSNAAYMESSEADESRADMAASSVDDVSPVFANTPPAPQPALEHAPEPVIDGWTGQTPQSDLDILVCEDNEVNQIVFTQILLLTDYSFKIAGNGREGLDLYKTARPKLILMDISMPEMNGLEATAAIRELEADRQRRTPIIGITAHAIKGDRENCLDAGMDDYLSKPVSPDALLAKIHAWIAERETPDAAQAAQQG